MNVGTLPLPATTAAHRDETLRGIATHLSDPILDALGSAIVTHADHLSPGRLYNRSGGGCAVGVLLRELYPETCGPGRVSWLRARRRYTIRQETGDLLGPDTLRLEHIERCFDATCRAVACHNPSMRRGETARHVGLWMACILADERARRDALPSDQPPTASPAGVR